MTALDKLRDMAASARRDSLIAAAEADILDRLARVAEDEDDERLDGALEELADNLRRALDRCVSVDDDGDLPSTGCPTCDAVLDTLAECHGMSLCGPTAADVAESARDWIGDLLVERDRLRAEVADVRAMLDAETRQHAETSRELDAAHAEIERLRAEVAALRERIDDADEWEPPVGWLVRVEHRDGTRYAVWHRDGFTVTHKTECPTIYMCDTPGDIGPAVDTLREAVEWCEAQMTSALTVGATDAGPDAPALIVEGDGDTGALQESAVPAAPVSGAEQSCGETGVDRPRDDERIVGPREGEDVTSRNPPYGYDVDDSGAVPVLRTVQSEAAVMLRICELLDRRANATAIAAALNAEGHTSRTGTQWTPSSVRARILGSVDEWRGVAR